MASSTAIRDVLRQVHPDASIAKDSLAFTHRFLGVLLQKILENAQYKGGKESAVKSMKQVLQGELAKHAVSEATKAITKLNHFETAFKDDVEKRKNTRKEKRAGLTIGTTSVKKAIDAYKNNFSDEFIIALTATMEYMIAEIMELSWNVAHDNKKRTISVYHILTAIRKDDELRLLFGRLNLATKPLIAREDEIQDKFPLLEEAKKDDKIVADIRDLQSKKYGDVIMCQASWGEYLADLQEKEYDKKDDTNWLSEVAQLFLLRFVEWKMDDFLRKCSHLMVYGGVDTLTMKEVSRVIAMLEISEAKDGIDLEGFATPEYFEMLSTVAGIPKIDHGCDRVLFELMKNTLCNILTVLTEFDNVTPVDVSSAIHSQYGIGFI